jgi:hypothetical protein
MLRLLLDGRTCCVLSTTLNLRVAVIIFDFRTFHLKSAGLPLLSYFPFIRCDDLGRKGCYFVVASTALGAYREDILAFCLRLDLSS